MGAIIDMAKYLRLIAAFARYGLMAAMEYRFNFFLWGAIGLMWAIVFLIGGELIFGTTGTIAGWTKSEALLLVATETQFIAFMWLFVFPNLERFSTLIRKGELDFYLLKPVSSRFIVSTREFAFDPLIRISAVFVYMAVVLKQIGWVASWGNVLGASFLFICGMAIFYNLLFALTITNFWLVNVTNLVNFSHSLLDMGRYPVQIYQGVLQKILIFILPVAYIGTFPVQALLGNLSPDKYFWAIFLVVATSILSQWFWNFALKRYSSASS